MTIEDMEYCIDNKIPVIPIKLPITITPDSPYKDIITRPRKTSWYLKIVSHRYRSIPDQVYVTWNDLDKDSKTYMYMAGCGYYGYVYLSELRMLTETELALVAIAGKGCFYDDQETCEEAS